MKLTKKVALYPNSTMTKVLDELCAYRRYCWNQGLELWNDLYDQRIEMVPADLRKKSQTHAAKEAPDFNRGRNWRTAWGK